jgi:hypothetical protein
MARKFSKSSKSRTAEVLASIDQSAETAITVAVIDHHTQFGSWNADGAEGDAPAAPFTTTDIEAIADETILAADESLSAADVDAMLPETINDEPEAPVQSEPAWADVVASFDDEVVTETVVAIADQVDARDAFENLKDPDNVSIKRTLKKVRSQLVTKRAARVLLASNQTPAFINRVLHDGSRYNVYALGKLADIVFGVTDGAVSNAINLACMKSLFRFKRQGLVFTGEMAKAAASDKLRVADLAAQKALIRHTVSASTAPTQASSTMQALETLGVVIRQGSTKNPTFEVRDTPLAKKLETMLLDAA